MNGKIISEHYKIIKQIASGGFGDTYLAQNIKLPEESQCVVKFLKLEEQSFLTETEVTKRFEQEAKILQRLGKHPQIPQLFAYYEEHFCLVQEFMEGKRLDEEIKEQQQLTEASVKAMLRDILGILEFVHENNVIHRDLKPANLIRRKSDNKFVLIDFGAVKEIWNQMSSGSQTIVPGKTTMIKTIAIGTPGYMPPEQHRGIPKYNSDIYALGIIALEALTGISSAEIEDNLQTLGSTVKDILKHKQVACSHKLARILDKMVANSYVLRYQSATEVLKDLEENSSVFNQGQLWGKGKGKLWGLAAVGVAALFISLLPSFLNAYKLESEAAGLIEEEKYEEALDKYDELIEIKPKTAYIWVLRGYPLSHLQRFQEQLESCDKAIELKPQFLEALNCKGLALHNLGKIDRLGSGYFC